MSRPLTRDLGREAHPRDSERGNMFRASRCCHSLEGKSSWISRLRVFRLDHWQMTYSPKDG